MTRDRSEDAALDRLVDELDRIDGALVSDLGEEFARVDSEGRLLGATDFVRLQIKAWHSAAARQGRYEGEALRVQMAALDALDRDELAAVVRMLVTRASPRQASPAA